MIAIVVTLAGSLIGGATPRLGRILRAGGNLSRPELVIRHYPRAGSVRDFKGPESHVGDSNQAVRPGVELGECRGA